MTDTFGKHIDRITKNNCTQRALFLSLPCPAFFLDNSIEDIGYSHEISQIVLSTCNRNNRFLYIVYRYGQGKYQENYLLYFLH